MALLVKSVDLATGVSLPFAEQGDPSGRPLLLLHGLLDSWRSFELVLPSLPSSIRAIAPTQRGHGDASHPATGYGLSEFAKDVVAFMDELHLDVTVIAGHSSHALVAQHVAIAYPERIQGLVLIGAPAALHDKPRLRELWETTISKLTDPIEVEFVREFQEGAFVRAVPRAFVESLVQDACRVPARVWHEAFRSLFEDDVTRGRERISVPTLLVWGDADQIAPRGDQDVLLAALPGSRLEVYEGTGHSPHWEEPARFGDDVAAFIDHFGA